MRSKPTAKRAAAKAARSKVMSLPDVLKFVRSFRRAGKIVVTANGCFDILHIGHVRYLEAAKRQGDILIVGVNSDSSVRANKGTLRPIVPERERAELVAALCSVDAVFIFKESAPGGWLSKVRSDVHAKGADWTHKKMPERAVVEKYGGRIAFVPLVKNASTTGIVKRILKLT